MKNCYRLGPKIENNLLWQLVSEICKEDVKDYPTISWSAGRLSLRIPTFQLHNTTILRITYIVLTL
jgi:hypothetical protein